MVTRVGTPITINQFDPASGFTTAYNNNGGGSDQCLVVSLAIQNSAQPSITAVTYNGVSLTKAVERVSGANAVCNLSIWVLVAPATGSNNVAISYSNGGGGSVGITGYVETLTVVNQTDPIGASSTGTDSTGTSNGSENLNFTITTEEADSAATFIISPTTSWTTPTGTTRLADLSGFGSISFDTSGFIENDTDAAGAKSFDAPSFSTTTHQFAGVEIKDKATETTDRNVSAAQTVALATQAARLENPVLRTPLWRREHQRNRSRARRPYQRESVGSIGPILVDDALFGTPAASGIITAAQTVALATQVTNLDLIGAVSAAQTVALATQAADIDLVATVTAAQSVALATQAANISANVALTVTAAQTVALAAQAADLDVLLAVSAGQSVALATQAAAIALQVGLTASQSVALATQAADLDTIVAVTAAQSVSLATQAADLDVIVAVNATQSVALATQAANLTAADERNVSAAQTVALATQAATLQAPIAVSAAQSIALATQAGALAVLEQITAAQTVALATQAATITTANERTLSAEQSVPLATMLAGILSPQPEVIARIHFVRGSHAVRQGVRGLRPSL